MKNFEILMGDTVFLDEETDELVIIDQTLLPSEAKLLRLSDAKELFDAIYFLKVRGAPAIGVAAAIGIYAISKRFEETEYEGFMNRFINVKNYLASARPTAVNLTWALDRMENVVLKSKGAGINELEMLLHDEAMEIYNEDIAVCKAIGENGFELIKDSDGVLTHCNAGKLATVRYGTALAPVYIAKEKGKSIKVFSDETRPLLQGARLTACELSATGVDVTLICDNMASAVMKEGKVQAVLVGCDRVAANGDTANKIGTSALAIMAKHYNIPFYVCAPLSTVDMKCADGRDIQIEKRSKDEVTRMWYEKRMAPEEIAVYNPAFDVTDCNLITAFITEKGVVYPPFDKSFKKLFGEER